MFVTKFIQYISAKYISGDCYEDIITDKIEYLKLTHRPIFQYNKTITLKSCTILKYLCD